MCKCAMDPFIGMDALLKAVWMQHRFDMGRNWYAHSEVAVALVDLCCGILAWHHENHTEFWKVGAVGCIHELRM